MNVNNTNNRSSAISFKGSSMSNKSRSLANKVGRASRDSRQNRVSNSKVNLEDINLELESMMTGARRPHFIMDPSQLGFTGPMTNFGTKRSYTTKNQNIAINSKTNTQNVQNLLREAKREMFSDKELDAQIFVGGEEIQTSGTVQNASQTNVFNFKKSKDSTKKSANNNFSSVI